MSCGLELMTGASGSSSSVLDWFERSALAGPGDTSSRFRPQVQRIYSTNAGPGGCRQHYTTQILVFMLLQPIASQDPPVYAQPRPPLHTGPETRVG
jgi:hypothetical protein